MPLCFAVDASGGKRENNAGNDEGVLFEKDVERIAKIPSGRVLVADSVRPRPGAGKVAYVHEGEDGFTICMNANCAPPVDRVFRGMPVISPDSRHWAAVVQKNARVHMILNGQMSEDYGMAYFPTFSPDSMKLAYLTVEAGEFAVYVNQDRHRAFPDFDRETKLVFSPDSQYLVYVAGTGGNKWALVRNGEPGPVFDRIRHVTFSRDSSRLAYAALKDRKWHLVEEQDGETTIGPPFDDITRVVFCPRSEQLAYVVRTRGGMAVVHNGDRKKVYDFIASGPLFSPNGERIAYTVVEAKRRGRMAARMVVDHSPSREFDQIGINYFSTDSRDFVYMAQKNEKAMIVHNGKVHEAYESVGAPVLAPETGKLAYRFYDDGQWAVKIDGEKGPRFDIILNDPVFGPNGERLAYIAVTEGEHIALRQFSVVENNAVVGTHSWADMPTFSPDGRHLVYAAADEGESFLVVDGREGDERFLSFLRDTRLVFTDDNTVQGIALRDDGRSFYRIRAEIVE